MIKRIEDMEVWKRGCRLAVDIYKLTSQDKFERDWGLRDQLRRSVVSISSNLAEGFERGSNAEFVRFALIARGSCGELRTQIYISMAIGYIDDDIGKQLIDYCLEISRMITGLIKAYQKEKQGDSLSEKSQVKR